MYQITEVFFISERKIPPGR